MIRASWLHGRAGFDHDLEGIQKYHPIPVPRIGGVSIMAGLICGLLLRLVENEPHAILGLTVLVGAVPVFFAGIAEDLTNQVSVRVRLLAAFLSALIVGHLTDAWITNLDVPGLDYLLEIWPLLGIVFTCFAVAGVTNAFNLVDGYNGLSSMTAAIILGGLVYVSFQVGDTVLMVAALAMIGAILGFFTWNYPKGLIFLGDGGAYLIGFWVAELSVLLVARNPDVSPWFPLLICFYPIFETIFTIYRRVWIRRGSASRADSMHLHQIIYRRIVRWAVGSSCTNEQIIRNSLTSLYLWLATIVTVIPAVLWWRHSIVMQFFCGLFSIGYTYVYSSLVKPRLPSWVEWFSVNRLSKK
jgi:UDP-N-acetylmuramyl pentapeptide phosphotransferase/UDP-N-acetylglucosamine-1-phosphate transferase